MAVRFAVGIVLILVAAIYGLSLIAPEKGERLAGLGLTDQAMRGNFADGRALFAEKCAACHGPRLKGTDQGPPLVHPVYKPDHHSDLAIRLAVKNGVVAHHWEFGDMPPVPGVTPEQVTDLIAFIRGMQRREGLIGGAGWPGSQGGTYGGNAVACAAALATTDINEEEGLVANAAEQGPAFVNIWKPSKRSSPPSATCAARG